MKSANVLSASAESDYRAVMLAIGEDFRTVPICADARWRSKMIVLNSEIPPNFFGRTEMLRIETNCQNLQPNLFGTVKRIALKSFGE